MRFSTRIGVFLGALCAGAGCTSASKKEQPETSAQVQELRDQVTQLSARIVELESKAASQATTQPPGALKPTPVLPHPAEGRGATAAPQQRTEDPEAGYVTDEAVLEFRQALVLFRAGQFSDAILAFSGFLDRHADHPLAGSAQFYSAECYFKKKEYMLALQEYDRVLTSYDRSPRVPDTLKQLSAVETILKMPSQAAKHRQLLLSLYPQSPAAQSLDDEGTPAPSEEPPVAEEPPVVAAPLTGSGTDPVPDSPPAAERPTPVRSPDSVAETHAATALDGAPDAPPTAPLESESR